MSRSEIGLTATEAAERLASEGPNRLEEAKRRTIRHMASDQLRNPFVLLLLGAAALAALLGERLDALAIGTIVVLNALVGVAQEWRAERALGALRSMTAPRARTLRDGVATVIPADEVVRGDALLLEAGDIVAADAHIVEAHELSVVEAPLTGESLPAAKSTAPATSSALAERVDHVFAGTNVATGSGRALVVATGMATEIGRIAGMLQRTQQPQTPLQGQLARISRAMLWACLAIVAVVSGLGLARGDAGLDVLLMAVALAVAAVPEGLPAVVTIALAVGVQRMAARHVLVRRLAAVQTLGCTTVICTDKTGTLTTGRMRVRALWPPGEEDRLLRGAAAATQAELGPQDDTGVGDPTEVAMLVAARAHDIEVAAIDEAWPRIEVHPFDSERMRMSIVRQVGASVQIFVKGALSTVAPLCTGETTAAEAEEQRLAAQGLRVLAIAHGDGHEEGDLTLIGLIGLADPPRPSAIAAIAASKKAGIRTVMLTGDHRTTAIAIATEIGLIDAGAPPDAVVHARVTPEDKLSVVRALTEAGEVVAMTGDGVNDAPAIRAAHVGIAMGQTGTEVTREAASIVLADDRFASIVDGIREGRAIYDNIRKTVLYLLAGNGAELVVVFGAALIGLPAPLLPIHLLWINLVTDGPPALALVMDPPDRDVMAVPPLDPGAPMLGRTEWRMGLASALVEASVVLLVYGLAIARTDLATARTLAFSTLVASELLRAFAFRSRTRVLPEIGALSNQPLIAVLIVSGIVQFMLTALPTTREAFDLVALPMGHWGIVIAAALIPVSVLEIAKVARRWRSTQPVQLVRDDTTNDGR